MKIDSAVKWVGKIASAPNKGLHRVSMVVLLLLMFLTVGDVVGRYMVGFIPGLGPIPGSFELTEFMLAVIVLTAIGHTQMKEGHISVDILITKFSPRLRAIIDSVTNFLSLVMFALVTWRTIKYAQLLYESHDVSGVLRLPVYPFLVVAAIGTFMFCLSMLSSFLRSLKEAVKNEPELVGILGMVLLLILFALRMQVGLSMLIVGFVGFTYLTNTSSSLPLLGMVPYATASAYSLSVIPLFILMGMFLSYGGLGRDIFGAANAWVRHVRGGMAMATIVAIAAWSAISGSATATAATIGSIVLPEMKRHGYSDALATACVAAGGTMDILIPPSSILVLYGILTEQSIGKLLIAGTLPGLLMAALFAVVIYIRVKRDPKSAPVEPPAPFREKVRALRPVWAVVVIFVLVMGGIYRGFFTPTEAAAVGAFISLIISLVSKRFSLNAMLEALDSGARTTAMLFIILIGAIIFSRFLAVTRIPFDLSSYIAALNVSRYVVIGIIIVVMVFLGCFIEGISLMVLTVPILYPLIIKMGFDGVWFGILMAILLNIGMCTPPVGMSVYVVAGVAKDVPLMTIFRGVVPFWLAMVFGAILLVAFPQIALWLPSFM